MEAQVRQYREDGYLAFADLLTADEVERACQALSELIQLVAHHPEAQRHGRNWSRAGSALRVQFESGFEPGGADDADLELKVRKLMYMSADSPWLSSLARTHAGIQGVLASLLGPQPVFYQDMALIKPPLIGIEKPWHQDSAYFDISPLDGVAGIWIALDPATRENGCMHVIPGGHRLGPKRHHHTSDCVIVPGRIDLGRQVAVELPPGGAMVFHGLLPHYTPANASPRRRRALQFHYRAAHCQTLPRAEYDRVFVEADGTPATCNAANERRNALSVSPPRSGEGPVAP
jgi:phytanoyl-CoA hydroxylase